MVHGIFELWRVVSLEARECNEAELRRERCKWKEHMIFDGELRAIRGLLYPPPHCLGGPHPTSHYL